MKNENSLIGLFQGMFEGNTVIDFLKEKQPPILPNIVALTKKNNPTVNCKVIDSRGIDKG